MVPLLMVYSITFPGATLGVLQKLSAPVINAGGTMKPKMNSQLNKDMDLRTNISFGDITDEWLPSG